MTTFAVTLSNGLQAIHTTERDKAVSAFQAAAAIGRCDLIAFRKCDQILLASSLLRTDAETFGAYEDAVRPFHEVRPSKRRVR